MLASPANGLEDYLFNYSNHPLQDCREVNCKLCLVHLNDDSIQHCKDHMHTFIQFQLLELMLVFSTMFHDLICRWLVRDVSIQNRREDSHLLDTTMVFPHLYYLQLVWKW